jgi:hypothetical protein
VSIVLFKAELDVAKVSAVNEELQLNNNGKHGQWGSELE